MATLPGAHAYTPQQCALYQLIFYSNFNSKVVGQIANLFFSSYMQFTPLGKANPYRNSMDCYMKVPVRVKYSPYWNNGEYEYNYTVAVKEGTAGVYSARTCFEMLYTGEGRAPPGATGDLYWAVSGRLVQLLDPTKPNPYLCVNARRRNLRNSGSADIETLALEENEDYKEALLAWAAEDNYEGMLANVTDTDIKEWIKSMADPSN